jgi:hypothetical protein
MPFPIVASEPSAGSFLHGVVQATPWGWGQPADPGRVRQRAPCLASDVVAASSLGPGRELGGLSLEKQPCLAHAGQAPLDFKSKLLEGKKLLPKADTALEDARRLLRQ